MPELFRPDWSLKLQPQHPLQKGLRGALPTQLLRAIADARALPAGPSHRQHLEILPKGNLQ